MIQLNQYEARKYDQHIVQKVPFISNGFYYFKDFFPGEPACARIGRRFYEDVCNHRFPNVKLAGIKARDGYVIF